MELVTWKTCFNADPFICHSIEEAAHQARRAGYRYVAYAHKVYALEYGPVGYAEVYEPADALNAGLEVEQHGAGRYAARPAGTRHAYLVVGTYYEYNDEYYDKEINGEPYAVFRSRAAAEADARHRFTEWAVGDGPWWRLVQTDDEPRVHRYDELVAVPWPVWRDWLADRGIAPPPNAPDDPPDGDDLVRWWDHRWPGATKRAVLEHAKWDLEFEVHEIEYEPEPGTEPGKD